MARSSSAKNGKNSKNTYRASGSKSSKSSSSGARHNSSASGSKKRMSRLEQRRAQQHDHNRPGQPQLVQDVGGQRIGGAAQQRGHDLSLIHI